MSTWNMDGIELTSASTSIVNPSKRDSRRNGRSALNARSAFTDDRLSVAKLGLGYDDMYQSNTDTTTIRKSRMLDEYMKYASPFSSMTCSMV